MNSRGTVSVSLKGEDGRRWRMIVDRINARTDGEVSETSIFKELVGLRPPHYVTETERMILAHGTDLPLAKPDQAPDRRRRKPEKPPEMSLSG